MFKNYLGDVHFDIDLSSDWPIAAGDSDGTILSHTDGPQDGISSSLGIMCILLMVPGTLDRRSSSLGILCILLMVLGTFMMPFLGGGEVILLLLL